MTGSREQQDPAPRLVLDGRRYVVLREQAYLELLNAAGRPVPDPTGWAAWEKDAATLGGRLAERRRDAGLTQGELAKLAGIRIETLNRIERGRTSPDFGTVRQLVLALAAVRPAGGHRRRRT